MIFTERTITVVNDSATINKPLILYRGDKNIELKITIAESQFKFRNTDASNVIETTDASYAQLVINTPYNSPIFSDVAATKNGAVIFVITEAMIDEIREVGAYEIQIRLLDDNKQSRASIPPVSNAIEIREPIAIEDGSVVDSNVVNVAKVNRALTTTSAPLEVFDSQGNYIKNNWGDGVLITDAALNKMEAGIDGVNKKIANVNNINDTTASAITTYSSNKIETIKRNIDSQIKEKANKNTIDTLQSQVNDLVLQSGGDSNLEVVQSRTNSVGSVFFNSKNHIDNIEKAIFNKLDRKYRYKWAIGSTNHETGVTSADPTRITTDGIIYADEDLKISMSDYNTYKFGIRRYPNYPDLTGSVDPGWIFQDTVIPKGTYFRLNLSKVDGTEHNMQDAMTGELFDAISILDGKTLEEFLSYNIKQIDSDVKIHNLINSRYSPLKLKYEYVIGSLPSSGIVDTSKKFRISTLNKISTDKEIIGEFDIINYKYWILYFDEDNNWLKTDEFSPMTKNNKTTIPANSIFMITMGRESNDVSEVFTSVYNDVFDGFTLRYSDNYHSSFDDIKKNKEEIENIKKNGIGIVVNEKNATVLATAHRGYSKLCPENTMVSYKTAYKEGFRILETDVKKTSDGVLVLLHDNTLNNTARNSDGTELTETINIADITYEQANQYDYGIYKGAEFAGEKLPKLEELLLYAKKMNCKVHIDGFASNLISDIFQLVRKLGMKDHVMWSSFIKSDLITILGLDAKATVIYNYSGDITNSIIDDIATLKTDLNEVYFAPYFVKLDADLGFIDYAHYKDIKVIPYAVDDETKILTYVNTGIDGICTNGTNVAKVMINN